MKKFFSKVWAALKRGFQMFIVSTWWVWAAVILAAIPFFIWGMDAAIWVFFGLVGGVILYILFRQIYWWFAGKVDYEGRGFPRFWKKIAGK